jgi:hypothetical protein
MEARREIRVEPRVIAKVAQAQVLQVHGGKMGGGSKGGETFPAACGGIPNVESRTPKEARSPKTDDCTKSEGLYDSGCARYGGKSCEIRFGETARRGRAATQRPRTRTTDEHEDEKNRRWLRRFGRVVMDFKSALRPRAACSAWAHPASTSRF